MWKFLKEAMTKRVTMKDVAELAGVSTTTVSHVINNTRHVDELTRESVEFAMKELQYQPNYLAKSLRSGETKTIGLIIPDSSNLFFAEISHIIEDIGFDNGYTVILCNSDDRLDKQTKYLDLLISKQVDGIVLISVISEKAQYERLKGENIPVVVVDRDDGTNATDLVLVDNYEGGYLAVEHLLSLGHRDIACITGPSSTSPSADRFHGYKQALTDRSVQIKKEYIKTGDFHFESGEKMMDELLSLSSPPTAVFVCNDMMAIGAIRAIRNKGLDVPNDLSIIGFDNIPISRAITPALTTISQPIKKIAEEAMNILFDRMKGNISSPFKEVVLLPELIIRKSTKSYLD